MAAFDVESVFTARALFLLFVFQISLSLSGTPALAAVDGYAGSAKCEACHQEIYANYRQSGHPFKIQKVTGGPPVYPRGTSPGVPDPPQGMTWNDITYVIGGYGWKARFMDKEGYILTGPEDRQYNLLNENLGLKPGWAGYSAKTAPRKPYTCGACHTTGWNKTSKDGPHQDGLPGIHGTWASPGVTCEACHGPGAAHATSPGVAKLSSKPNCDNCHVRGDVTKIDAFKGMIRHHEQYEDLLSSPHRQIGCLACHDPHLSTKYSRGGFKGQTATCIMCHETTKVVLAPELHWSCIDCHMPYAAKSAVSRKIAYKGGSVPKGDIRSHIHRINDDPTWSMFTDDGKYVRTDDELRAYLTVDFACLSCHTGKDKAWAVANAKRIHGEAAP